MLTTIIYRSHLVDDVPVKSLDALAVRANAVNESFDVTGILLFNGTHFFQVLEGPHEAVNTVYNRICQDKRHHNVVELLRDYAPLRRFGNVGMELFDLREYDKSTVLSAVLDKGTSKYQLTYDDRALQFLRTFVEASEKENYFEIPSADSWAFIADEVTHPDEGSSSPESDCDFAFKPIIDPLSQQVVSYEAVLRSSTGGSPQEYFARFSGDEVYHADLHSKMQAFALAKKRGLDGLTLSINLFPLSLVVVPDAVSFLLRAIHDNGLVPEQIIIQVTESEITARLNEFQQAIRQLKGAGISLSVDDFGAGTAGLLLLARIQPDKININRDIISDVHKSGPRQAIVHAIISCCASMHITVIATGIEKAEEWMWLEAAGICQFQGPLFGAPAQRGIPAVAWPELR